MEYECDIVNFENLCWQFGLFTSRYAISVADDRLSFSIYLKLYIIKRIMRHNRE